MNYTRRGEIYLVEFDPARGHEIQKTRPALVIQNNIGNRHGSVTIVAATSARISSIPFPGDIVVPATKTNGLSVEAAIKLGQIRSVDRGRLIKRLGLLDAAAMQQLDEAIKISLGLIHSRREPPYSIPPATAAAILFSSPFIFSLTSPTLTVPKRRSSITIRP